MALNGNYIPTSDKFIIEDGILKPIGNIKSKLIDVAENFIIKPGINNQPAYIEFMRIYTEEDLITFALKRGIPTRDFNNRSIEPIRLFEDIPTNEFYIATTLLLNDAKLMRWIVRLSKFLRGTLKENESPYPDEETIQHLCDNFVDNQTTISSDFFHLVNLPPVSRRDYAINQISETTSEEYKIDIPLIINGETIISTKSTPEAIIFAKDILTDIARYVCKSVYRAPNFYNEGNASWHIYETSLLSRLFFELFEKIASDSLIHRCDTCGQYFLGVATRDYCSPKCKKTMNQRNRRHRSTPPQSPRGRKIKEKVGV